MDGAWTGGRDRRQETEAADVRAGIFLDRFARNAIVQKHLSIEKSENKTRLFQPSLAAPGPRPWTSVREAQDSVTVMTRLPGMTNRADRRLRDVGPLIGFACSQTWSGLAFAQRSQRRLFTMLEEHRPADLFACPLPRVRTKYLKKRPHNRQGFTRTKFWAQDWHLSQTPDLPEKTLPRPISKYRNPKVSQKISSDVGMHFLPR